MHDRSFYGSIVVVFHLSSSALPWNKCRQVFDAASNLAAYQVIDGLNSAHASANQ